MKFLILNCLILFYFFAASAQIDSTKTTTDEINFDDFVSADGKSTKIFCNQKINYLSPYRFISVGYENIASSSIVTESNPNTSNSAITTNTINNLGGIRLALNAPVIAKNNVAISVGATAWNSNSSFENSVTNDAINNIAQLNSLGLNTTIFKPFNEKNFAIFQISGDINGNYSNFNTLTAQGFTLSATAIYGWKKSDNFMWGVGLSRTYRAGALIHIPVVLYNKTFNKKWGIETVFPAKLNIRRNFSPTSLLMLGYEIEGNSYHIANASGDDFFLRRGELKPRFTYEQKLAGFIWLSAQAGMRYNWRFDAYDGKNPVKNEPIRFENSLTNAFYFNCSLNFVSP